MKISWYFALCTLAVNVTLAYGIIFVNGLENPTFSDLLLLALILQLERLVWIVKDGYTKTAELPKEQPE